MTRQFRKIGVSVVLFGMALAVGCLMSCGKKEDSAQSVQPTFSSLYTNVFSQRCIECHRPGGSAFVQDGVTIDFSTLGLGYSTFVNHTVSGTTSNQNPGCHGAAIVGAAAGTSYTLAIFFSDYGLGQSNWSGIAGCTPYDHTAFLTSVPSASEKAALVDWINSGAQKN